MKDTLQTVINEVNDPVNWAGVGALSLSLTNIEDTLQIIVLALTAVYTCIKIIAKAVEEIKKIKNKQE